MTDFQVQDHIQLEDRSDAEDILGDENQKLLWTGRVIKMNAKESE